MALKKSAASDSVTVPAMKPDSRYEVDNLNQLTRRISRPNKDDSLACSQQSVLNAMDRFVKAVNNMDSTVLVPSRLQDMDINNANSHFSKCLPTGQDSVEVYRFYNMLKDVKNELLWGPTSTIRSSPVVSSNHVPIPSSAATMKCIHRTSVDSLGTACSSSDQETDSDMESVGTDKDNMDEHSTTMPSASHLANAFRRHLLGMHTILNELSYSANYLTSRYQEEIETVITLPKD